MAHNKYFILIIFLLALHSKELLAQRHLKHKRNAENWSLNSIEIGMGIYKPFLNYWNQESFVKNWETKFSAAPILSGNVEFTIINLFNIRVEGQYWTNKASNFPSTAESGISSQDMTLKLIPITGSLCVNLSKNEFLRTYIGAGGGICFINSQSNQNYLDASKSPLHVSASGSGNMFILLQGFDFQITQNVRIGIETRYTTGSYNQSSAVTGANNVSLDGVLVLAKLAVTFGMKKKGGKFAI